MVCREPELSWAFKHSQQPTGGEASGQFCPCAPARLSQAKLTVLFILMS